MRDQPLRALHHLRDADDNKHLWRSDKSGRRDGDTEDRDLTTSTYFTSKNPKHA